MRAIFAAVRAAVDAKAPHRAVAAVAGVALALALWCLSPGNDRDDIRSFADKKVSSCEMKPKLISTVILFWKTRKRYLVRRARGQKAEAAATACAARSGFSTGRICSDDDGTSSDAATELTSEPPAALETDLCNKHCPIDSFCNEESCDVNRRNQQEAATPLLLGTSPLSICDSSIIGSNQKMT